VRQASAAALFALGCASFGCADIDTLGAGGSTSATDTSGTTGGSGGSTETGTSTSGATTFSVGELTSTLVGPGGFSAIFTILLENHDYNEIVGSPDAPYINSLIAEYGLATNYYDSGIHPSLPNYLYLVSGYIQYPGHVNLDPVYAPYFPVLADNLGNQLRFAGIPWRSYQESMIEPCRLSTFYPYVPRHNPFPYFTNIQNGPDGLCAATNVDYSNFAADLAAGAYHYMWITPDQLHNGHDPANDPVLALQQSDAWLSVELPKILASDAYTRGGVVFLTWDEAVGRNGNSLHQVPMIVISPKLKSPGMKVATKLTHASYLATIEEIYGFPKLGAAAHAPTLFEFFE